MIRRQINKLKMYHLKIVVSYYNNANSYNTPVPLLIAANQPITWQRQPPEVQTEHQDGEER